jgi:branched-chain amino acid transport system permease protein
MPDGVLPAISSLVNRFRPKAASIREESAAELLERSKQPRQAEEVSR